MADQRTCRGNPQKHSSLLMSCVPAERRMAHRNQYPRARSPQRTQKGTVSWRGRLRPLAFCCPCTQ
jgi:hypothetical protein